MGIKIKNLQTGEFEKFNIPALKGEKGEPGEIEPSEKVDYIGKQHSKLRDTMNANVDYIIKTAIGEFNYLDYEGQRITATNSIEGHARSAILSGRTLVNLVANPTHTFTQTSTINETWKQVNKYFTVDLQVGKTYIALWDMTWTNAAYTPTETTFCFRNKDNQSVGRYSQLPSGKYYCKATIDGSVPTPTMFRFHTSVGTAIENTLTVSNFIVLEYQEGMENWDIPYFTGVQSVQMPVLTTTGKNLFDAKLHKGLVNQGDCYSVNETQATGNNVEYRVEPNTQYTLSFDKYGTSSCWIGVSIDGAYSNNNNTHYSKTFTTNATGKTTIRIGANGTEDKGHTISNIMLRKVNDDGIYEPYKTNILSTPEEVVLRSLPNGVKDTLNLNTGEYVQRIGEVVLNGSESWALNTALTNANGYYTFQHLPLNSLTGTNRFEEGIVCDKFPRTYDVKLVNAMNKEYCCYHGWSRGICICINGDKLSTRDVNGFKQWLSNNPTTVQYQLATPVVKTVDLSDNHVYSYKGTTHYSCSSEEGSLVPTLSVKVPTDTQLTIQEQKATTQTLLIKNMDLQQSIKEVQAMNLAFNTALCNSFNSIREEVEVIKKHVSTNENLVGCF